MRSQRVSVAAICIFKAPASRARDVGLSRVTPRWFLRGGRFLSAAWAKPPSPSRWRTLASPPGRESNRPSWHIARRALCRAHASAKSPVRSLHRETTQRNEAGPLEGVHHGIVPGLLDVFAQTLTLTWHPWGLLYFMQGLY